MSDVTLKIGSMYRAIFSLSVWNKPSGGGGDVYCGWIGAKEVFMIVELSPDSDYGESQFKVLSGTTVGWVSTRPADLNRMFVEITAAEEE